jgi:hypothetical protein
MRGPYLNRVAQEPIFCNTVNVIHKNLIETIC